MRNAILRVFTVTACLIALSAGLPGGGTAFGSPPTDGLALWLDAADADTIFAEAGKVSQWQDKSVNERHANQTSDANRGTLLSNALAGKPVVDFGVSGSNQWMLFGRVSDARTIFWVIGSQNGGGWLLGDTATWHFARNGGAVPSDPLWSGGAHANVLTGQTFRNGQPIDGMTTGLTGGYDIVSLVTAGNVQANQLTKDRSIAGRHNGTSKQCSTASHR